MIVASTIAAVFTCAEPRTFHYRLPVTTMFVAVSRKSRCCSGVSGARKSASELQLDAKLHLARR
jgi:hypothetical protein